MLCLGKYHVEEWLETIDVQVLYILLLHVIFAWTSIWKCLSALPITYETELEASRVDFYFDEQTYMYMVYLFVCA